MGIVTMKFSEQASILEQYPADVIIERLSPYVNELRQQRINAVINGRLNSIQLAIEAPCDINNAFAAIRTAEALGVGNIHIISPEGAAATAKSISIGALYWVDVQFYENLALFLEYASSHNITLAGGCVEATTPLQAVSVDTPLCIMIGNEHRGLSQAAQRACSIQYKIPMVGMSESMNLSVSAAISLYDTTQRKRTALGNTTDLSSAQQQQLRAKYLLNSVAPRLARGLFLNHP